MASGSTNPAAATDVLALATRGLAKRYGAQVALAGLDLSVPSGIVYGFLGPNGAGKTTTMRILTGLIRPDGGTVEILGRPFGRADRTRLFDVGALVESPSFYPYLSGRENLRAFGAAGAATSPQRVDALLELVGLRERAGIAVSEYSLGMKQRLGIAAALLSDPKLLLLDEPANGLDPAGIVALRDTLRRLAAGGKTVFVSSHILGEVRQLADRVGIIAAGRLVREGPMAELLLGAARIRFTVDEDDAVRAGEVLGGAAGGEHVAAVPGEPGRFDVHVEAARSASLNRALAEAGIYAAAVEPGSDLEELFLEVTGGHDAAGGTGGSFMGEAGIGAKPLS